jgi:hypothetical protein
MSNLNIPADEWLKDFFEFENCDECGGDERHHTAVGTLGNWFAYCNLPPNEETGEFHPTIAEIRETEAA